MKPFKVPRVYYFEYTTKNKTVFHSDMVGVAFNNVEAQQIYDKRRLYERWLLDLKLKSEKLSPAPKA